MANTFLTLPMPALNGAGASVDCSTMGSPRTITCDGTFAGCSITVEVSNDGGATFSPLTTFTAGGVRVIGVAGQFMRVNVSGRKNGVPFDATIDVGAPDSGSDFADLPIRADGNGPGDAVDVSTFGTFTTFVVTGAFPGAVVAIEISEFGEDWSALASFNGRGGIQSRIVSANFVRTNVRGRKAGVAFNAAGSVGAAAGGSGSVPDPLIVDNLTVNELATIEEATIQFATIQQLLDVRLADNTPIFRAEADGITADVNMSLDGDLAVLGDNLTAPGISATPNMAELGSKALYLTTTGGGTDPQDGSIIMHTPAERGMIIEDANGNRGIMLSFGGSFGDVGIGFNNASPSPPVSITGATTQLQVDAIVALLVTFGLGIDNR